jgi:hypothetical protein
MIRATVSRDGMTTLRAAVTTFGASKHSLRCLRDCAIGARLRTSAPFLQTRDLAESKCRKHAIGDAPKFQLKRVSNMTMSYDDGDLTLNDKRIHGREIISVAERRKWHDLVLFFGSAALGVYLCWRIGLWWGPVVGYFAAGAGWKLNDLLRPYVLNIKLSTDEEIEAHATMEERATLIELLERARREATYDEPIFAAPPELLARHAKEICRCAAFSQIRARNDGASPNDDEIHRRDFFGDLARLHLEALHGAPASCDAVNRLIEDGEEELVQRHDDASVVERLVHCYAWEQALIAFMNSVGRRINSAPTASLAILLNRISAPQVGDMTRTLSMISQFEKELVLAAFHSWVQRGCMTTRKARRMLGDGGN